ncbi:hypothetical protein SAMN05216529_12314 [Faecalicatena contorta]|uniref:Uncharacterized protein n=1 Tax=Faecalicatena contorta TaxID=39482 RepID=A0A315ZNC3_9FIRM|nr:hypothetical protein A8805_12314 [Faecalicatena contorta]SUQ16172.1 hypothetical protein SAMN05216529_12314 [Faecalicatena contorta]
MKIQKLGNIFYIRLGINVKRVFGLFEAIFDMFYLSVGFLAGVMLLIGTGSGDARLLAGIMTFILIFGDAFHLVPRIRVIMSGNEESLRSALGRGKQITSITMTIFYLFLWQLGLMLSSQGGNSVWTIIVYILAAVRILICLFPQNRWSDRYPPVKWGIWRNIPFFMLGVITAAFFFLYRSQMPGVDLLWLAILLSFAFYLPVVLWANQNPKVGMFMLPKTCAYLWILYMCLSL